jgi:hypothetical protein
VRCYEFYGGRGYGNACDQVVYNSASVICVPCPYPVTGTAVNLMDLLMDDGDRMLCHACHVRIICSIKFTSETFCKGGQLQEPAI